MAEVRMRKSRWGLHGRDESSALKAAEKTAKFILHHDAPYLFQADYRLSYRPDAARDG